MGESFAAWVEAERGRFVLLLPVAMGAAILVYFALPAEPPLWLAFVLPASSVSLLAVAWPHPVARFMAALLVAASLGLARAELRTAAEPPVPVIPTGAIDIAGTIARIELLPDARRVTLIRPSLDAASPLARSIRLRLRGDDTTPLAAGEAIRIYGMVFGPDRPAYPGAWDPGRQDFYDGLAATGFALSRVTITAPAPPNALDDKLQTLRTEIAARIMATLPASTGSIAVTLLTGEAQTIPAAERDGFIAAGLAHILAVAGLHVGIVMGLAFSLSRFLLSRHERLALHLPIKSIAAIIALLAGAGYAALTGAHLPILRSLAMASLATLGIIAGRRALSLRGLALAAMVILLATPEAIIGVSFQMSFSAVLALIAGYAAVQPIWLRLHAGKSMPRRVAMHLAALAYTSLLAGGASMPFAAYQFQQIQPYWIPANLIAVPLTAFWIMPLGLVSLALMPIGFSALTLVPMGWGISVILRLTTCIAAWPGAMLRIPPMPDLAILLISAGLIWLCIWRSPPRLAGILLLLAGFAIYADTKPPDVLVSSDAKLIAIRSAREVFLVRQPKAASFILAQWAPVWGSTPLIPAQCTGNTCRLGAILFAQIPPASCGGAELLVSPQPVRGACGAIPALDRFSVYENGAMAAWIKAGSVRLESDRQVQGQRPWVVPYPKTATLR